MRLKAVGCVRFLNIKRIIKKGDGEFFRHKELGFNKVSDMVIIRMADLYKGSDIRNKDDAIIELSTLKEGAWLKPSFTDLKAIYNKRLRRF